jgi:alpha-D-xyloside xylohydrolase
VLRVFALDSGATAPFVVAAVDGTIAARGTVTRDGDSYRVRVVEGALHDWAIEVDGERSPVQTGQSLDWKAK